MIPATVIGSGTGAVYRPGTRSRCVVCGQWIDLAPTGCSFTWQLTAGGNNRFVCEPRANGVAHQPERLPCMTSPPRRGNNHGRKS